MRLTNPASNWPTGNGELAALIRNFDWSQTSLGPSSAWPAYVRNCVDTILLSPIAIATMWNQDAVMIYNDAYAEIAGKRHPAILGSQALLSWPEIADFNRSVVQQVLAGGTLKFIDQELTVHRNGMPEQIWLDLYYSPVLDHQSRPCAVLAMVMENTRRVLAERQRDRVEGELLASNEALRRANEDLEQFAFSASHDLQEPVRMMALYNQLLRRKLKGKLDAEAELLLNNCGNGALRLEDLLKDLLEYTHLSTKEDAPPSVIVFPQVLEKLTSNLEPSIHESGAAITWDEFPALKMQSIHLYQLLRNLLSNAIKYRSDQPLKVHVGATRQDSGWVFSVRDNGIGIEPAYQKQIFGLFKRLHTNSDYPGTGLGLAICKKLVERYGGTIAVESKPGSGSTFYFTLPSAVAG